MDPFTQGLLGASFASSFSKNKNRKVKALCGALGGMAPDLDVLIFSVNDPLLFLEYHRHFTHSIFFVPFGGLLVSIFLYFFLRNIISFKNIFLFSTLGFLTHGLLDACTSYGTNLFWPFFNHRVAWNIISIIDPIFTITLLTFLILYFLRKSIFLMRIGVILSFSYLIFGVVKYQQVKNYMLNISNLREHKLERLLLNPTFGNNFLWRSVYQSDNYYYVDAVYMPLFSDSIFKEGEKIKVIDKEIVFPELTDSSIQRNDIKRFSFFSQDFIYLHPNYENVIADLRYGTLPYDSNSLWGIKIDIDNKDEHVSFKNLRNFNSNNYKEFWLMLNGVF
ncbi:MAG: metal-dependent hydrolase [Rickettsiales bacterium]|nr:metal-dependent hydrolase [Rickettsiales bacterium]